MKRDSMYGSIPFGELRVYRRAEQISDTVWKIGSGWDSFSRETVGRQRVRAADSIGANIAVGMGRGSFRDNRRFIRIARGSRFETRHWLRRPHQRRLLNSTEVQHLKRLLDPLGPSPNAYLPSIGPCTTKSDEASDA